MNLHRNIPSRINGPRPKPAGEYFNLISTKLANILDFLKRFEFFAPLVLTAHWHQRRCQKNFSGRGPERVKIYFP